MKRKSLKRSASAAAGGIGRIITEAVKGYVEPETGKGEIKLHALSYLKKLGYGVATALLAYAFGGAQLALGAKPMGTALLCASKERVIWSYVGLVLSALLSKGSALPYILIYTVLLASRYLVSRRISDNGREESFGESLNARIIAGGVGGFAFGMYRMIAGGMLYYDMLGAVFEIVVTPVGVWLFGGAFERSKKYTVRYEIGVASLMFCTVWSLRGINIAGFSLSAMAAFILTLYVSKNCGVLRGGVIGILLGIAFQAVYAPAFGLAGLASGLLWGVSAVVATAVSCIVGITYGMAVGGYSALYAFAPDIIGASVIFLPAVQFGLLPKLLIYGNRSALPQSVLDSAAVAEHSEEAYSERIRAISDSMEELSEVFYTLSDRLRRPGIYDVRSLCERTCLNFCDKCGKRTVCWEEEGEFSADVMLKISNALISKGEADKDIAGAHFAQRCDKSDFLIDKINGEYASLLESAARTDKLRVYALDYLGMAKILKNSIVYNEREYICDEVLSERCRKAARFLNFYSNNIVVYGNRRKQLIAGGVDLADSRCSADELRRVFSGSCGVKLSSPEYTVSDDYVTMTMKSVPVINVKSARFSKSKDKETMNGDSICAFRNSEDYYYTLLSDGMGSGKEAALASRMSAVILEKMLKCGNRKGVVLELLNNFLRDKNEECFTTVDLLEIDLLSGKASFTKSGAAPSFVLRGGNLFKISSNSMPVGIVREMNAEEIKFDLFPGDIVVMISDGIASGFSDSLWLAELLSLEIKEDQELDDIAKKIMEKAENDHPANDDMTVGLVRVEAA